MGACDSGGTEQSFLLATPPEFSHELLCRAPVDPHMTLLKVLIENVLHLLLGSWQLDRDTHMTGALPWTGHKTSKDHAEVPVC